MRRRRHSDALQLQAPVRPENLLANAQPSGASSASCSGKPTPLLRLALILHALGVQAALCKGSSSALLTCMLRAKKAAL